MALPRQNPESQVLHCGWTDPRNLVNWHVRSYRDAAGVSMIAFRRSGDDRDLATVNRFEVACDRLEDHQIALLLDQAKRGSAQA